VDLGIANKRILITGALLGVGLTIAKTFLQEGERVMLLVPTQSALQEAADRPSDVHGKSHVLYALSDCADASLWPTAVYAIEAAITAISV
jgi:NAD(P)-dependent dehydrogenase (short-subunit alcohol dehydrogenase family)